jgi:hypothetical protein
MVLPRDWPSPFVNEISHILIQGCVWQTSVAAALVDQHGHGCQEATLGDVRLSATNAFSLLDIHFVRDGSSAAH